MKIRTIKPEFWVDQKISKLPIPARLLYIGLWNFADDNGVFRAHPALIKSSIFPYDDSLRVGEVGKWLDALVEARMVEPFSYEGESFAKIRTFRSHQKVDPRYPNELISWEIVEKIFSEKSAPACPHRFPSVSPPCPQRVPVGAPPQEVEVDMEVEIYTHSSSSGKNSLRTRTREEEAFEVLIGEWLPRFAPNIAEMKPLTLKQYLLLRKSYYLADIARVLFVISSKTDPTKVHEGSSMYAVAANYLSSDRRVAEQREAEAHNASLSEEGLARGTCSKRPIPLTTRASNPELGYIFDYCDLTKI